MFISVPAFVHVSDGKSNRSNAASRTCRPHDRTARGQASSRAARSVATTQSPDFSDAAGCAKVVPHAPTVMGPSLTPVKPSDSGAARLSDWQLKPKVPLLEAGRVELPAASGAGSAGFILFGATLRPPLQGDLCVSTVRGQEMPIVHSHISVQSKRARRVNDAAEVVAFRGTRVTHRDQPGRSWATATKCLRRLQMTPGASVRRQEGSGLFLA